MLLLPYFLAYPLAATATWTAYQEYLSSLPQPHSSFVDHASTRPSISFNNSHAPWWPCPTSPKRNKTCYVQTHNDLKTDDSAYILQALHNCNNGGHVVFPQGKTYVIAQALDMTFLQHVDIDIQAYIQFSNDTTYWQTASFPQTFQNATTFFQLGGVDINVFGGGMLDGNGQVWYDLYATNIYILRPILFGTIGLVSGSISNLRLRYSPQWYNFVANSTGVVFDGIDIRGASEKAGVVAKNTDGWDTYRSGRVVVQNSVVNNGDDCVSFKPNSSEVIVQNLRCNGSHGVSVGSLGQYVGEVDVVENILVSNITITNATDAARIKVWPGSPAALSGDLQGGGGSGHVNNITYTNLNIANVDYAIEVTQCYGQKNLTLCNAYPSKLNISNVVVEGVKGTTSSKYDPISGYVVCSGRNVCSGIQVRDLAVVAPSGVKNEFTCGMVDEGLLVGVNCTTVNKGSN